MDLIGYIDNPEGAPPGAVRLPTRAEVRAVVMAHVQELRAAAERGEIIEHVALDQQDRVSAYVSALEAAQGEAAAATFTQIWLEETEAATSATNRETAAILDAQIQRAQVDSESAQWIAGVLIVVVGVVVYGLFFA